MFGKVKSSSELFRSVHRLKRPRQTILQTTPPVQLSDNLESDMKQDKLNLTDARRLERDVLGMKSTVLRSLPITFDNEFQSSRFLPPAPGLRWLQLTSSLDTRQVSLQQENNFIDSTNPRRSCTLSFALVLPHRDHCETPWKAWRGKGSIFGINYTSTILSSTHPSTFKSHLERPKTFRKACITPKNEGALLPVVFSIRHYRYSELLKMPLLAASGQGIGRQSIAQFLTHFHIIRHSQPRNTQTFKEKEEEGGIEELEGDFQEFNGRRPPQILHTWEMPHEIGSSTSTVLGIDYEASMTDESIPRRHALTLLLDSGPADSALEVCISAPANSWDGLWEGEEDEQLSHSIGVVGRGGLKVISESFTILNDIKMHAE
jgi:hypothetical protein